MHCPNCNLPAGQHAPECDHNMPDEAGYELRPFELCSCFHEEGCECAECHKSKPCGCQECEHGGEAYPVEDPMHPTKYHPVGIMDEAMIMEYTEDRGTRFGSDTRRRMAHIQQTVDELVRAPVYRSWPNKDGTKTFGGGPSISDMFVNGNSKLKGIKIFDLPAVFTCPNCEGCSSTCYALHQQHQYPAAWNKRMTNLKLTTDPNFAQEAVKKIEKWKEARNPRNVLRWHSSGDVYSQKYADLIKEIAGRTPGVKHYLYTKTESAGLIDLTHDKPKNLNVINSFIHGKLNYGDAEHVQMLVDEHKAFRCPASAGGDVKCGPASHGGDCSYCVTGKRPAFLIHGTSKGGANHKDPRWGK